MALRHIPVGFATVLFLIFMHGCSSTPPLAQNLYTTKPAFYSYIVGSINAQKPLQKEYHSQVYTTPASCQKTITALLAYKFLGSSFQYSTTLSATHKIIEKESLHYTSQKQDKSIQDLVLSFSGDPTFTSGQLLQLLAPLQGSKIRGQLFIDATKFKTPPLSPNLMIDDLGKDYAAPVSAFILDRNQMNEGSTTDVESYAIEKVTALLKQLNIHAAVVFTTDPTLLPQNTTLMSTNHSIALGHMLPPALKESDNLLFDSLYLTIISHRNAALVKWEEGNVIVKYLIQQYFGVDMGNALVVDGSGVSRYNRIQPKVLFEILRQGYGVPEFVAALPYPSEAQTTLEKRTQLAPTIRAKTGSMSGISCLCGYNLNPQGAEVFVFVAQNFASPLKEMYVVQDEFINGLFQ